MIELDPNNRYYSFDEILIDIYNKNFIDIDFTESEKEIYQNFALELIMLIGEFKENLKIERDINKILQKLHSIIAGSILEIYVQNTIAILQTFMTHSYTYHKARHMRLDTLKNFYQFLAQLPHRKQQIVLDNLHNRLSTVKIVPKDSMEDVPF
jgi:serine/threonine-protein kinase